MFRSAMPSARGPYAAPGNGLLNNLIAFWPGNEVNGNALDMHTNALTLTDNNTVTSNPGKVYALARQYTAANNEWHYRNSEALLQAGDIDFTIAAWIYPGTVINCKIISKDGGATIAGDREYLVGCSAGNRYYLAVFKAVDSQVTALANSYGAPVLNAWTFIVAWHDSVANTANIQINNGVVDSVATGGALQAVSATQFRINSFASATPQPMDGRIGPTAFWKSAGGAGGVLTAAQRTSLYNAGAGLPYASFTV